MTRLPRLFAGCFPPEQLADDGNRLNPTYNSLGDDSVPCRWWHPDMGPFCARCGSGRMDLHDGEWAGTGTFKAGSPFHGEPWTTQQRSALGLPVEKYAGHHGYGGSEGTRDAGDQDDAVLVGGGRYAEDQAKNGDCAVFHAKDDLAGRSFERAADAGDHGICRHSVSFARGWYAGNHSRS